MIPPRQRDAVDVAMNHERRLTNLETGAHPVRALADFYSSVPLTSLPERPGGVLYMNPGSSGSIDLSPVWMKRSGLVTLGGGIEVLSATQVSADGWYGTLPPNACPFVDFKVLAVTTVAPWRCTIEVKKNGQLHVHPEQMAGTFTVFLDGITYLATL